MPAQPTEPDEEAASPGTESEKEDQEKHATAPGGSDGPKGNKPGSGGRTGIADEQPVDAEPVAAHETSQAGGGPSPVLPILVAVAVLAAISIGAVVYRQRHTPVG